MSDLGAFNALFWRIYSTVYDVIWDSPLTGTLAQISASHLPPCIANDGQQDSLLRSVVASQSELVL